MTRKRSNKHDYCVVELIAQGKAVPLCPEQLGGLPTPRKPCELISQKDGTRVQSKDGQDFTEQFLFGAQESLRLAQIAQARFAVLKEGSPSCGKSRVASGEFDGQKIPGEGLTAGLFRQNGIRVFSEEEWDEFFEAWQDDVSLKSQELK